MLRLCRRLFLTNFSISKYAPASSSALARPYSKQIKQSTPLSPQKGKQLQTNPVHKQFTTKYPLDEEFIIGLVNICRGLTLQPSSQQHQPIAPVLRLQYPSIAGQEMQQQLARVLAERLDAKFLEISQDIIEQVELNRVPELFADEKDISAMTLSAIAAMHKQDSLAGANGLYPLKKEKNKKKTDFVMFTIPALNYILEEASAHSKLVLAYFSDLEEFITNSRDRKLLADFIESFNRLESKVLLVAPAYRTSSLQYEHEAEEKKAVQGEDFKVMSSPIAQEDPMAKYGPLWHPNLNSPLTFSSSEKALFLTIPKPSDPGKVLVLRQSLAADEQMLLCEHNYKRLCEHLSSLQFEHTITLASLQKGMLGSRALSGNELIRICLEMNGLSGGEPLSAAHLSSALDNKAFSAALQPDTDPIQARFAQHIQLDKLNTYEKHLLKACVTTPGMIETRYSDVAGAEHVKLVLDDLISKPIRYPHIFSKGILRASRSGILLFGPPGTGKTMLARAVAAESGATFIAIGPADLNSKWVGEGEKFARAVFTLARKLAPTVIFLDEIDSLLESRETASTRSSKVDILSELMMQWDGMWDQESGHLVVMGATNRPYALDAACLRRLPRRLLVDLPDVKEREEVLRLLLREDSTENVDLKMLAEKTDSYSGSDLKHLCQAAVLQAANECTDLGAKNELSLGMGHFEAAMKRISPSVSSAAPSLVKLRRWNEQYGLSSSASHRHSSSIGFE